MLKGLWARRSAKAKDHNGENADSGILRSAARVAGLRSSELSAEIAKRGFARAGQLLTPDEIDRCVALAHSHKELEQRVANGGWFPTILLDDVDEREAISQGLADLIRPRLNQVIDADALNVLRMDYSVKPASEASELGPHQDFALIDERLGTVLYLWIPLVNTDAKNGTLHVVPGSHRFANLVRSQHVPSLFNEVLDLISEDAVALPCAAGELIVMAAGVVHFSPPNRSGATRLAAHGMAVPAESELIFYFADEATPADRVECYPLEIDHYIEQIKRGRPSAEVPAMGHAPRPPTSMTRSRYLEARQQLRREAESLAATTMP